MWSDATVTKRGALVLEQCVTGTTLTITRAKLGTETVSTTSLDNQTDVSGYVYDGAIAVSEVSDDAPVIMVKMLPQENPYTAKQIGIFGKLGSSGTETLIAIYQDSDGVSVPTKTSMPEYVYYFRAIINTAISGSVSVSVESGAYMDQTVYDPDGDGSVLKADYATSAGTADTATTADKATALADDSAYMKVESYTGSGTAYVNFAKHATSADSATSAARATSAERAAYADSAAYATSAGTATTADTATALENDSAYMKLANYTGSGTAFVNNAYHANSATSATSATKAVTLYDSNRVVTDADTTVTSGVYYVQCSTTSNTPVTSGYGILFVLVAAAGKCIMQMFMQGSSKLYIREQYDTSATRMTADWYKLNGIEV